MEKRRGGSERGKGRKEDKEWRMLTSKANFLSFLSCDDTASAKI